MTRRSVVLVHPPQQGLLEGFSSGLIALANFVETRTRGVDVSLLDLGTSDTIRAREAIANEARRAGQRLVAGISTTTASYHEAIRVARTFKDCAPGCMVVLGGHHASPQDDVILRRHAGTVDVVVRGEGERALLGLTEPSLDLSAVPGISFLHDHQIQRTRVAPLLTTDELDTIGVTFRGDGIRSAPGKFDHVTYVSARGCPLGCHFCAVADESVRAKSIARIVHDLAELVVGMGYHSIAIEDNFFAQNRRRTVALCRAIAGLQGNLRERFGWDCQTRVESMQHSEVLKAMERAGCDAVYLGVESVDPEHLTYLGKTTAPERYLQLLLGRVVPMLLRSTVDCYLNLQLGIPGETRTHQQRTIAVLHQLGHMATQVGKQITIFPQLHVVYPGTHHFQQAIASRRFGAHTAEIFEPFTEWEAEQEPVRSWLGEHFAHGTGGITEGILNGEALRRGEFVVDGALVLGITNTLSAMARIPGIRAFSYAPYLATNETGVREERRAG